MPPVMGTTRTRVLLHVMQADRPTPASTALALGLSRTGIHYHLAALAELGLIAYGDGRKGVLAARVRPRHISAVGSVSSA